MKKVLFVIPNLQTGGAEKLVIDLATFIDKKRFEVLVLSFYPKTNSIYDRFAEERGISVKYLDKKKGMDFSLPKKIGKVFKEYKPNIISTHLNTVPYLLWKTRKIKAKYYTVHSLAQMDSKGLPRFFLKIAFRFFGFTPVAICDTVKKTIAKTYRNKLDRIPCIYNGIDTSSFVRKEKTDTDVVKCVSVGRLTKVKNHTFLIEAFSQIYNTNKDITLTILGDGPERENLKQQIKELKLENAVILTGNVPNVKDYLSNSDIYLSSSKHEGLPLTVLEAMSCGLPIITTKAGGVVDIVEDDKNGFLVEHGDLSYFVDVMFRLLKDEKLRLSMGEKSFLLAKKYDIKNCAEGYMELFGSK